MNERIKELEQQSYFTFKDENSFECRVFSKEKFALLIVEECLLAISKTDVSLEEVSVMLKCHDQVEKHFGVEE